MSEDKPGIDAADDSSEQEAADSSENRNAVIVASHVRGAR